MIRKSLFAVAASFMTLTVFSGTLSVLYLGAGQPVAQAPVA